MKNLKKILALLVAALIVVASMAAIAEPDETKPAHDITVANLQTGDKTNFYRILKWAPDDTNPNAVNGWVWNDDILSADNGADGKLTKQDLYDAIDAKTGKMNITSALAGKIARVVGANGTALNGSTPITGATSATWSVPEGAEDQQVGLFMAIITPEKQDTVYNPVFVSINWGNDPDNDSFTMITDSTYSDLAAAKKSTIPLEKTSNAHEQDYTDTVKGVESDDETKTELQKDNGKTVKTGDLLDFDVDTSIPGYGSTFQKPVFKLTDTLNGLALNDGTITVYLISENESGEEVKEVLDASNYTVTGNTAGSTSYTITFKEDYLKTLKVATDIRVSYVAKVTKPEQFDNVNKEKNTVTLEYSHDPSTESDSNPGGDKEYKKDITNHYTFSIDADTLVNHGKRPGESGSELIKVAVDKDGNPITSEKVWSKISEAEYQESPLEGATFSLYKIAYEEDGTAKKDSNGKYVLEAANKVGSVVSDGSGRLKFEDLDAGSYILVEDKAPAGYVKNTEQIKIDIDATFTERELTEYYDQEGNWYETEAAANGVDVKPWSYKTYELQTYTVSVNGTEASTYTFNHTMEGSEEIIWSIASSEEIPASITNTKGVELPSTGGIGTTIFYVGGSILVLLAGVLLVTKRRMSAGE